MQKTLCFLSILLFSMSVPMDNRYPTYRPRCPSVLFTFPREVVNFQLPTSQLRKCGDALRREFEEREREEDLSVFAERFREVEHWEDIPKEYRDAVCVYAIKNQEWDIVDAIMLSVRLQKDQREESEED